MAVQMFLVQPKDGSDDIARAAIAEFIAARGGFILMATSHGSLIAAFDDRYMSDVKAHYLVDFVGGVTLDPGGKAASQLLQLFAQNVALQVANRGDAAAGVEKPAANTVPPGYRPLQWKWRGQDTGEQTQQK